MVINHLAGQRILFLPSMPGLDHFKVTEEISTITKDLFLFPIPEEKTLNLITRTSGWVGNTRRDLDVYQTPQGLLIHVLDCGKYLVFELNGVLCLQMVSTEWNQRDQDFFLGPGLVLALALRAVWSLHASAAMFTQKTFVFLGDSGSGKSTLAAYLSKTSNWNLVADDILPVQRIANEISILPHFPQLKLSMDAQPGANLPERQLLDKVCVLKSPAQDAAPKLELLPPGLAIQALLRHTAGTRMFSPEMLGKHLSFCSKVSSQVPIYQLTYPHRKDVLPVIRDLLENLC